MLTSVLQTRVPAKESESVSRGFLLALTGHVVVVGVIAVSTWIAHVLHPRWGEPDPSVGSIQASMVTALPLPPHQLYKDNEVLTSDKPSIAPTPAPPVVAPPLKSPATRSSAAAKPKPAEIDLPGKRPQAKSLKAADHEEPVPPRHVTPPPLPTPKATTGETSGVQIPQSVTNLKNGTATITVEERAFGDRYAYYIRLISQKVDEAKQEQGLDPPDARGKRAAVRFTINRDGVPLDPQIVTRSGSSGLDTNALRTIQRIDTFGPLPAGDHLTVTFGFSDER